MDMPELVVEKIPETDISTILDPIHFAQSHRRPYILRLDVKRCGRRLPYLVGIAFGFYLDSERQETMDDVTIIKMILRAESCIF